MPTRQLTAVHFTSAVDGVGLAASSCAQRVPVTMAVTRDGGATWTKTGSVLWRRASPYLEHVVATSTRHVWASQPDGPLLETTDGGRAWEAQPVPTPVDQMALVGGTVWVLSCTAVDQRTNTCTPVVAQQSVGGGPWHRRTLPTGPVFLDPTLDVVTPATAVVLAVRGPAPAVAGRMLVTTDGGRQWTARPVPTGPDDWCDVGGGTTFTAGSATTWWLLCNGGAAAGSSAKALLETTDGGATWTTVADVANLQTPLPAGSLTTADADDVDAASPSLLWFATADFLTESTDGGRRWQDVPTVQLDGGGDLASFDVTSPTRAWLLDPGVGLWSTADGTTWRPLGRASGAESPAGPLP